MKISDLISRWSRQVHATLAGRPYHIQLPLRDAARIEALHVMYPNCSEEEIVSDLLRAALDELEIAMPYVPGSRVIAEDDQGDPIYEDLGPTPRFYTLSHEFLRKLSCSGGQGNAKEGREQDAAQGNWGTAAET